MSFRKRSLLLFLRGVAFLLLSTIASRAEPESPLCRAIRYRNWPEALRLVEAGAAVTAGAEEFTPLGMLAGRWYGSEQDYELRLQLLQRLIERGADPFARAGTSDNPHLPISMVEQSFDNMDSRLADLLLTNRPSATRRTPTGETALHLATTSCRTNIIAALIAAGFSVNQTNDDGLTPLQSLVWARNGSFILTNDTPPYFQRWVMRKSLERSQPSDVAEFLLAHGAALDACSAAGMGMTNQLAGLLRTNPASLNMRDGLGRTPLHYATFNSQTNAAAALVRAGGDVSVVTTKAIRRTRNNNVIPAGSSALHFAALREQAEITQRLLKAGASPAHTDADGNTPLHLCAHWGATNCSSLLVKAGAPLDSVNVAGKTPLRVAVESGSFGNVELLLKSGARANTGRGGETLLHVAADKNPEGTATILEGMGAQTIPFLLRGGIPVDVRDSEGRTPLHRAVTSLNWKAMNLLLTNGADVNAVDNHGNTALHQLATQPYDLAQYENHALWEQWVSTNRFVGQQQVSMNTLTNTSVTGWLLEHGAKPNLTNYDGKTPLDLINGHRWTRWESELRTKTNRTALLLKAGAQAGPK